MPNKSLVFQSHTLETIRHEGKLWFTSATLATALGYSRRDKITQIYNRNADEFTPCMSLNLKLRFEGLNNSLREKEVRVFSLRGAHLIAMFASTAVAKDFRKWVLDLIDQETAKALRSYDDITVSAHRANSRHADLPPGVYHEQSKYNPYRALVWHNERRVSVGQFPTVQDATEAIENYRRTGVVQRLQTGGKTIDALPYRDMPALATQPAVKTDLQEPLGVDFMNHMSTFLEAAQFLSCYHFGKDLAWDLIAFAQEESQRAKLRTR